MTSTTSRNTTTTTSITSTTSKTDFNEFFNYNKIKINVFNNVHFKHHLKFNDFYKIDYYTKNIKRPQQRLQQRQLPAPLLIQRFLQPHQKKNNNDFNRFHYKHNFNNNDNYNKDIKPYFNV